MIVRYVVPASRPLTVLHIQDEDREAGLFSQKERIDGWTWCGLPLKASELWLPADYRQGDRLCAACARNMKRGGNVSTSGICTCQVIHDPRLKREFGPGVEVTVKVLKLNPGCPAHTGPPSPLCRACTDDDGSCACTKPCGSITCTGGEW